MGQLQCCKIEQDLTESKVDENSRVWSPNESTKEEECDYYAHVAGASTQASCGLGVKVTSEDGQPAGMGMATMSPAQDITVNGHDSSPSTFAKLEHPATDTLGQNDQTGPIDKVTANVESRNAAGTSRAASEQQSTVEDTDSHQSPNKQKTSIVVPELEAFRDSRMREVSSSKPTEPTNGWSSCGDDTTECWVKVDFKRKPWTTNVFLTESTSTAMLHCGTEGPSGILPIFCEQSRWPEWFPFTRETSCLHIWEDGTELWYLKARVAAFTIDSCVVVKLCDHLLDLGYVETVSTTPPADAKDVCGVTLPKKPWGCIRGECDKAIVRFTPTSLTECTVDVEYAGKEQIPVEWVVRYLWGTLSKKVVPLMASQQDQWRNKGFFKEAFEGPHGDKYRSIHAHLLQRMKI